MVTKAIVLGRVAGTNRYTVRIPYFETAGDDKGTFEASLCTSPSLREEYREGDVVFVGFQDHQIAKAVILGSLFLTGVDEPRGFSSLQNLSVSGNARLPSDTTLGSISVSDLESLVRKSGVFADMPEGPGTDGTYVLACTVSGDDVSYKWTVNSVSGTVMEPLSTDEVNSILNGSK